MEVLIGGGLFAIVFAAIFAVNVAGFVFWIFKLIEVVQIPDHQYRAAGSEKLTWVLVVVLTSWIGALIWQFAQRDDVLAAAGRAPSTPPGWYRDRSTSTLRWWDGSRWTEHHQA